MTNVIKLPITPLTETVGVYSYHTSVNVFFNGKVEVPKGLTDDEISDYIIDNDKVIEIETWDNMSVDFSSGTDTDFEIERNPD